MSSDIIKIKRGLDIKLAGQAEKKIHEALSIEEYALKPTDFRGVRPRLLVKEGDSVKAGTPLFYSKDNEQIMFSSPVSGTVIEVLRGEKRVLLEIKIKKDETQEYIDFGSADPKNLSREEVLEKMLKSGVWPLIRQRPYAIMANPIDQPKAIFISAFDSAPLAPDKNFIVQGYKEDFQAGIHALSKLTNGKIHLNIREGEAVSDVFTGATGVQINRFKGPHPAGNVGVQIHHIDPINKGEKVWYCYPEDVIIIGRLFLKGIYQPEKIIALTGSEIKEPAYYRIISGAKVENLLKNNLLSDQVRVISGNILTGTKIYPKGFIGFYDSQITVIPEGNYYEMFGWLSPGFKKFSFSRTFLNFFNRKNLKLDTNLHGGERPFIVTGQYEKVFPFDIYPVYLLKACLTENIDKMEQLGIYEVAPEDFALCEVVCTSKINSQDIIQKGIDLMIKEMS
ncbi:MAG TPA: Na(+)-translocating NADH-quinone reductase subunit A [Bacteroidia bacterium]|nr:Na(+)-translocating NADH-quinone reductase subunit A [Bacteroidia bacterium]HRS58360.1 Na(+)-translocating NADH-quinone reductase subunit A [Bacteroidia bacterium]HRU69409.1 Na(+)-translocating NADH-quinone reductase subunit A [Bacteroidia bacterium]